MKKAEMEIVLMNEDVVVTSGCDPELQAAGFVE